MEARELLAELTKPFHPSRVSWKPGATKGDRALALAYADLRVYMERLDEVCGDEWEVSYEPWGNDRIICRLTIAGVMRSSTGEMAAQDEKNEMGGTVAEAQAFKRACAMFGLGRYLYTLPSVWVDFDASQKQIAASGKAKLNAMLDQHYRKATGKKPSADHMGSESSVEDNALKHESPPHQRLWGIGQSVVGKQDWDAARGWIIRQWCKTYTPDNVRSSAGDLSEDEKTLLGDYINQSASEIQKAWPKQKAYQLRKAQEQQQAA